MPVICGYVPILHQGYLNFFERHAPFHPSLFIFGDEIIKEFDWLRKDIRALDPFIVKRLVESLGIIKQVAILDRPNLPEIERARKVLMPDEEESRQFAQKYLAGKEVLFENIFLRWDLRRSANQEIIEAHEEITSGEFDRQIMKLAQKEAKKSSDWWRRVGAVIVKDGRAVIIAHNRHLPSQHTPYVLGDARSLFKKGERIDLTTAIHAEADAIAQAASRGINVSGCFIYTITFPCPPCAKLIARSGIEKLYFKEGYSLLDAKTILENAKIRIVRIV